MEGLRERASVLVTEELGPRRDLEIARAREKEVSADRFTSLDRRIETLAKDGQIDPGGPTPPGERFEQALIRRRLAYLGKLGLAAQRNDQPWRLEDAWNQRLRQMGREGDRIREIAAAFSSGDGLAGKVYDPMRADAPTITGRVVADGPVDELRNRRYLIIDGLDGERWHVSIGEHAPGALPPRGAIVELSPAALGPRSSDRTIARIAALHGGAYSDALHETLEPAASTDYRRAHVRRLEALRRAGIVTRDGDGTFRIGGDYLRRASAHDAVRSGGVKIEVKSWLPTETLINRRAPTWLDSLEAGSGSDVGYGKEVAAARMARRANIPKAAGWAKSRRAFPLWSRMPCEGSRSATACFTKPRAMAGRCIIAPGRKKARRCWPSRRIWRTNMVLRSKRVARWSSWFGRGRTKAGPCALSSPPRSSQVHSPGSWATM